MLEWICSKLQGRKENLLLHLFQFQVISYAHYPNEHGICWNQVLGSKGIDFEVVFGSDILWWFLTVAVHGAFNRKSEYIKGMMSSGVLLKGCTAWHWSQRKVDWKFRFTNAWDKDRSFQSPHQDSNPPRQPPHIGEFAFNPRSPRSLLPYWSDEGNTPERRLLPELCFISM